MKSLFTGMFVCLCLITSAQKSPIKFGEIPMADLTMDTYEKDTSASAVVLVDYGVAYLEILVGGASLNFERHTRIKILSKDGLKWADVEVPLFHAGNSEEKITGLKATAYNLENGKIVESKLSKDGIFKEKFNRNITLHKFTLPNVKEGSVIEFSYTVRSEFLTRLPNWEFQETIPIRHSEYWATIPDFFIYEKYMQGYIPAQVYEVKPKNISGGYQAKAHHWLIKDVPAFKEEPYMTSKRDYISKINFALSHYNFPGEQVQEVMGSWNKLNDVLLEDADFGGVIRGSNFLKDKVDEITAGMTDPIQKITAIHNHVKQNFEWDGVKDFYALPLKKLQEAKKGSAGDMNLYLASMLEKAALDVDMVLVSTRDHGFIRKEYPMHQQFNYVVCAVRLADKTVFLDATERFLPVNVLPERCLNGEGLVISKTRHGWIKLETKAKAKTSVNAELTIEDTGDLKGKLAYARDGYDAISMRNSYISKGEEAYVKDFLGTRSWEVNKTEFQNIQEIDKSTKENHELTIREHATAAGDVIYINPFVTSQIVDNPFKLETREYPVDFGSSVEKMYFCKFTLPEGYAIDEIPESKILLLPGNAAKYVYNVAQAGNTITVTSNFQINKNIFVQNEYANLREFYNQVVAKQAQQIVLKKK